MPTAPRSHYFALSRAMIVQAKALRDAGDCASARELARRARALDALAWAYA